MGNVDNIEFLSDTYVFDRDIYESTQPDSNSKGILRTITGPIAEWDKLNRNKRKYSERLWDRTLESPYVKEQLRYKTLYGEANHPTDRYEVDFSRVSHSITDMWKVPASNQIYATINILDTPLGRILNTLYEAGGVLGYSTRAGGTLTQKKGYVDVDENTYNFVTVDAVPYPSVESARPPIVEGVEQPTPKKELSDDIHDKLCEIIKESTSENREVIKSLIYSLESYDLSREISVLDEESSVKNVENEPKEETTMSLLKESSLQIDNLKAENQTLQAAKLALEKENTSLRNNLSSSVASLTKLIDESKNLDTQITESESRFADTIKELRGKISDLEGQLLDKDLEIECLESATIAVKALQYENKELKSSISSHNNELLESALYEKTRVERELEEICKEVSIMVSESADKDLLVQKLNESIESYKARVQELEVERDRLVENASKINESVQASESLINENTMLKKEIDDLNESLEVIGKKADSYKDELLSVICSGYNLTVESVKRQLPIGFTKSDVYCVCEGMSNSIKNGIDYSSVVSESTTQGSESVKKEPNIPQKPNGNLWVNRRGMGLLNK